MISPIIRDDIRLGPKVRYAVPLAKPAPVPVGILPTATMVSGSAVRVANSLPTVDLPPPDGAGRVWAMATLKRSMGL
jgi:hypothetical protein